MTRPCVIPAPDYLIRGQAAAGIQVFVTHATGLDSGLRLRGPGMTGWGIAEMTAYLKRQVKPAVACQLVSGPSLKNF